MGKGAATGHGDDIDGINPFAIATKSISGWYGSDKTGQPKRTKIPYASLEELKLGLYIEYHPRVVRVQRGDLKRRMIELWQIAAPKGSPYAIKYVWEGKSHDYLPDYVGDFDGGGLLVAEAGLQEEKSKGVALAKADAARELARIKKGRSWIGTEKNLSGQRFHNLVHLHARREPFSVYEEIAAKIRGIWLAGDLATVDEIVQRFGRDWSDEEVEAAAWKLAGDQAAAGHLLVDLDGVVLSRSTPLALSPAECDAIDPPPLPDTLEVSDPAAKRDLTPPDADQPLIVTHLPGPAVDADHITDDKRRQQFRTNLAAVLAVLEGKSVRATAAESGMNWVNLARIVRRTGQIGEIACVPYGHYERPPALHPELATVIKQLYRHKSRQSITAIREDAALRRRATELTKQEGRLIQLPSYDQVRDCIGAIKARSDVRDDRSGNPHPPRQPRATHSYVLSIRAAGDVVQVDEHDLDVNVVTYDPATKTRIVIKRKVHGAVLICVKTGAILSFVLSLEKLQEKDYMILLKRAMEPKARLTALWGCRNPWDCTAKPSIILHDGGPIFWSHRAVDAVVEGFGIVTQKAPPHAPQVKGTVEAFFKWVVEKFTHRLPGTTGSHAYQNRAYDNVADAKEAGITFEDLESLFAQAVVDDYLQDWDELRGQTRVNLWAYSVKEFGVPRWLGSPDALKFLLMKAENHKKHAGGAYKIHPNKGVNLFGRWYVSPGLFDRIQGLMVNLLFNDQDMRTVHVVYEGKIIGEAYCPTIIGRVSKAALNAQKRFNAENKKAARENSREARTDVQEQARQRPKDRERDAVERERQRQRDRQSEEMQPTYTLAFNKGVEAGREAQEAEDRAAAAAIAASGSQTRAGLARPVRDVSVSVQRPILIHNGGGHEKGGSDA